MEADTKNDWKKLLIYSIVSRGGELKFLCHDFNIWDHYGRSLQGVVTRLKTRSQHPFWIQCVPCCDKSSSYQIDFLHAFGSLAAIEDGFFRMDPKATGSKFWFPCMRMFSNEKVVSKFGNDFCTTCSPFNYSNLTCK